MILNTNFQGCMPSGSMQEDLLCVPYINLWKAFEIWSGPLMALGP